MTPRDPQRCAECGKPESPFGFGLPPQSPLWACGAHREVVAARFVPEPYTPLPRTGKQPWKPKRQQYEQRRLFE